MSEIASKGQLRLSLLRWAMVIVPTVEFLGLASGIASGSGAGNGWYAMLQKPDVTPPGWVFGVVWPILYLLTGLALALVLSARGARGRGIAVTLFIVQFVLNLIWSPLFFGAHEVTLAALFTPVILAFAVGATICFGKIRALAAWLMLPYLCWLGFASILAHELDALNPDAERLMPSTVQIQG